MKKKTRNYSVLTSLSTAIVLLGLWEYFCAAYPSMRFVLPAPSKIGIALWQHAGSIKIHLWATLKEMLGGFAIAFFVAFPLAWLMVTWKPLRTILQPLFVTTQCIPMFALAPLMVLWFGWSYAAIVIPTALMIFFPLTMNIFHGLSSTPGHLIDFFSTHQATRWQVFVKLRLPWAVPQIFAGFRIAIAIAGIGAVAGEWAGAQEGLGLLMLESRRAADIEMMFAGLACVTTLSLVMYGLAVLLERMLLSYRSYRFGGFAKSTVAIAVCAALLTGCHEAGEKKGGVTLILDWLPNPDHTALYAGIEKGFFAEKGIDLQVIKVADPSDTLPFLTTGQVDMCLTYMPYTIKAQARGAEVVPIGILIKEPLNGLIYRTGEGIQSLSDLNGKVFGYCADGSQTRTLQALLKNASIEPKEMKNAGFDLVAVLASKQVDCLYGACWNIECENLREWGVETSYFPLSAFGMPNYYELIFLVKQGSRFDTPEFITAFQTALQKSIDFSKAHPEEAFQSYLQANPDKSDMTKRWERRAWDRTLPVLADRQEIDSVMWKQYADWLQANGLMPKQ